MNDNKDKDRFLLCFADIKSLFQQSKYKILCCALGFSCLAGLFALTAPIRYQAEGSFREKGVKSNAFSSSVLQLLSEGSVGNGGEANSLLTSRKILNTAIEELHLQAHLQALDDVEGIFSTLKNNFKLFWASLFDRTYKPVLKDPACCLKIDSIKYVGEVPVSLLIQLQENGYYEILDLLNSKQFIGKGKLGETFQIGHLSFNLVPVNLQQQMMKQTFLLKVDSLSDTVKNLCKVLTVEPSKNDKSLLVIKCDHRNRHLSSEIINSVMSSYQNYLKKYHQEMATSQLDYLGLRRDQLTNNLVTLMEKHANYLANDLYNSGFIESDKEMEFLAKNQHEYKRKLLDNELEIKRLINIKPGKLAYYENYSQTNTHDTSYSTVVNDILSEMRNLKQERDSLEIELQKKAALRGNLIQQSFEQQLNELKEVQEYLNEINQISQDYEQGNLPNPDSKLLNDPRFLLKGWFERLQHTKQANPEHWKETNENFKFYLNNLERLFGVHERILQERLTHQQNPSGEYQGVSLSVATDLYLDYSKQLVQIEATIRQNLFFITQIEDPNFEISSLSSGLSDSVSMSMIHKASELLLNLRDQNNQSAREQERIKADLQLQRTFLTMHLKQMVQLMDLNKQLMNEKIFALQNVSLELIHQRISLLEKNLQDYLKSRIYNLEQEKSLIKHHLESIHGEMALLPKKWVSEKLITQEVETNRRIVEEIVKLVESKNISHKLDVIQSAPVDLALAPVHPLNPKFFLWSFMGFFLGGLLGSSFILGKTLNQGLKVSTENLEMMGFHVSGKLTTPIYSLNESRQAANTNTLRRLQAFFDHSRLDETTRTSASEAKLLLLIEGQGPHYAPYLADLLIKKQRRVLMLDLNFSQKEKNSMPGLSQYLQGAISTPSIHKGEHGDWIASGGLDLFAVEMMGSPLFQQFIHQMQSQYDWILAVSPALATSAEAENLLRLFPHAAVTLKDEKTAELAVYHHFVEQPAHKLTFIIAED